MSPENVVPIKDTYLGDGVYASYDGDYIILDLRAQDVTTVILLDPVVLDALDKFRERINDLAKG